MALPTDSKNLVTVERLSAVIGGTDGTGGLWGKTKALVANKADKSATVSNVAWSSNKLTKTINGTTSDVVTASTIKTALSLTKSDVGLGNVNNTAITVSATDGVTDATNSVTYKYTHPTTTAVDAAAVKVGKDSSGHVVLGTALSKSDVGLGAVVNTGDSATPVSGGTTKFTTGGAYTELAKKANLASPALTGTPTAPTADAGTNTTQIATTAFVKTEINNVLDAADAMQFKGTIGSSGATVTTLPTTHKAGWTYKVATAGTYAGKACEVGDMIICVKDGTAAADADWTVVQNNIDGAVTGPASAVDARVAVFNGTTGKVIKDSGYTIAKSVPSDAVFTDVSVTSAANHYAPSTVSGQEKSASASGATAAWSIDVVKGVTLNTDGKGHVTGISVISGKIPANPNTDTKVKATAKTDDVNYKILATASASPTSGNATEAVYGAGITLNPSTNTIAANISGNAATATSATTASNYATGGTIESALAGKAASNHTHDTTLATDSSSGTVVSLASNTQYKLTAGGSSVLFKTPANPTVNNAALKIQLNGGTATSKFTANASSDATLTFATGSSNGTIAVDGTDVAVKGLGTAAYTASTEYATSTHTHSVTINGETKTIPASGGTAVDLGTYPKYVNGFAPATTGTYPGHIIAYGDCTTGPATKIKEVTLRAGTPNLSPGARVVVNFEHGNTVKTGLKLSINGGTAISIYQSEDSGWVPEDLNGPVMLFLYNNGAENQWEIMAKTRGRSNANSGTGYATCDTAEATAAKVGTLSNYMLRTGGIVAVKFTYAVPASATLNINSAGAKAIYYRGAAITAGVIGAGDTATFVYDGTQYQLLSIDSGEAEMTSQEVTDLLAALT